ncbi:fused MFS/spermidine synthase [Sabulicella rubraurantiaca]|uniref:fused MFS/spermidine synthase n=1 Tax=Sabulicella rubraurantiaca TaxID=2811429 RepID=UPI001A960CC7|nr:fused MFS/spermidine synthase [Sabulicella rubraurantiaca]
MTRLMIAFFLSGFGALLCQIIWQRMLGVFAGSDTVSAALVVGAFLAGLGLGSILGAKWADRLSPRAALTGFALCEAGVALCALLSKFFLYDFIAMGLSESVTSAPAIFALCFAGLVVPTTLMGASLPFLARAVATSLETVAERIGTLYGLNTFGAGLGALLGGWFIVGNLGYVGALALAAGLDLVAAGLALTLLGATPRTAPAAAKAESAKGGDPFGGLPLWCVLVFLSGYVIVALEIVWVRVLGQFGQYHAYLFPTVLGIFLLADGLGMALAARMVRRMDDPRPAFFLTQGGGFALGALLLGVLWWAIGENPLRDWMGVDFDRFGPREIAASTFIIFLVVAPPSFIIGMTFPFVQRAVQQDLASVGARVGWVQLANILGNAAGSILTGLVTFHYLGTAGTLRLLAMLSLLLLLFWLFQSRAARRPVLALAGATALILVATPGNAAFWTRMHGITNPTLTAWGEDRSGVVLYRERATLPGREDGRFFIMGHGQGFVPFLDTHILLGMLGPLLHPEPRRILAIGVGSGGTPYGATVSPRTEEIRAIELVAPVLEALEDIARERPDGAVASMLADPRVTLEYGDGRRALTRGEGLYDVIEADAIRPQSSHSGLLYSAEFLQQVRARLAPGGLYVQWAPTWRVIDTFAASFPHAILLTPVQVMIGSDRPIRFDHAALLELLRSPEVIAHARRGNPRATDLTKLVGGPVTVWDENTPRAEPPLTDMFPRDEFFLNHVHLDSWRPRDAER